MRRAVPASIAGATTCRPLPSRPNLGARFGSRLTFQDESGHMAVATGSELKRPAWKPVQNSPRLLICLAITFCSLIAALPARAESPAEMISNFRLQHGEGRVTADPVLNRIAHEQAAAMAAQDVLDHSVLGQFSSRMAPSGSRRSAENIAYGYDTFPKTLNQWIDSSAHRKNLLLQGASRVGVASAKSAKTGRTYWSMEIAADYERAKPSRATPKTGSKPKAEAAQACRLKILSLCL
jgi:uncharacterized protein YkwD